MSGQSWQSRKAPGRASAGFATGFGGITIAVCVFGAGVAAESPAAGGAATSGARASGAVAVGTAVVAISGAGRRWAEVARYQPTVPTARSSAAAAAGTSQPRRLRVAPLTAAGSGRTR